MNKSWMKNNGGMSRSKRAFTLIEMIVSLAIFAIVAVVALGALAKIISANKKAQTLQSAMTNLNFALEAISREMRVGSDYECMSASSASSFTGNLVAGSCEDPVMFSNDPNGTAILFVSDNQNNVPGNKCNLIYAYEFAPNPGGSTWTLEKAEQSPDSLPYAGSQHCDGSLTFAPIIDPTVTITGYTAYVSASDYPLASLRISGYVGTREKEKTYFDVQTAVSARVPSKQ